MRRVTHRAACRRSVSRVHRPLTPHVAKVASAVAGFGSSRQSPTDHDAPTPQHPNPERLPPMNPVRPTRLREPDFSDRHWCLGLAASTQLPSRVHPLAWARPESLAGYSPELLAPREAHQLLQLYGNEGTTKSLQTRPATTSKLAIRPTTCSLRNPPASPLQLRGCFRRFRRSARPTPDCANADLPQPDRARTLPVTSSYPAKPGRVSRNDRSEPDFSRSRAQPLRPPPLGDAHAKDEVAQLVTQARRAPAPTQARSPEGRVRHVLAKARIDHRTRSAFHHRGPLLANWARILERRLAPTPSDDLDTSSTASRGHFDK